MPLQLHALFSDHMVLQQGLPAPVWGWADAGETITRRVCRTVTAPGARRGRWRLEGDIAGDACRRTVRDHRAWRTRDPGRARRIGRRSVGLLRAVQHGMADLAPCGTPTRKSPRRNTRKFACSPCRKSPSSNGSPMSKAPGRYVRRRPSRPSPRWAISSGAMLHQQLDVPIGLINTSWGGTLAEAWTSREKLLAEPSLRYIVENFERELPQSR